MLRVHLSFGNVAHIVFDDAHAHERRRLTDRANAPLLFDDDFPDFLGTGDLVGFLLAECFAEQIEGANHFGIVRLFALGAIAGIPLGKRHTHVTLRRVNRQRMARKEIEHLGTVVRPGDDLLFVVRRLAKRQIAFGLFDVYVNADLFPVLLDHLADLGVRHERAADGDHFEAQASFAIGAEAETFAVLFVQAHLVEQVVGLLEVERSPFLVPLGAGAVDRVRRRSGRAGYAHAKPKRFVELIAVNAER